MVQPSAPFRHDLVERDVDGEPEAARSSVAALVPILQRLADARRPRLEVVALSLAAGVEIHPTIRSQADAARALGVTRAAVNKHVTAWRDEMGLRSPGMRSDDTRERCAIAQMRNHWRRRKGRAESF